MLETAADRRRGGWYHGWTIVIACILSQLAANALPINAFSLFLRGWSAELHATVSTLTIGIAACGLTCAILSPVAGVLTDRFAARWLMGAGIAGVALFCLGVSLVRTSGQLVALYALLLPVSLICATSIPANALVSRWFTRRLGLALGLTAFGLGLAGVVMPPLIAALLPSLGWRLIWRAGAAVIAFAILPGFLLVVRERPDARDSDWYLAQDGDVPAHGLGHGGGAGDLRWRDILGSRTFWLLVIGYLPMLALYGGAGNNLVPMAANRGLSAQAGGLLLSAYSFAQLAATLAGGALSDRLGSRLPLAGLSFLTAAGGLLLAGAGGFAAMLAGAMLVGVGGAFWPLLAAAIAREFAGRGFGRAFGTLTFFLPFAVASPFAVARSQEATGSYAPALLVMVVLAVVGGIACLLIRERRDAAGMAAPGPGGAALV